MPLDACTTISGFCLTQADSVCTWGKRGRRPEWVQAELWDEERGEPWAQTFLLRQLWGEMGGESSYISPLPFPTGWASTPHRPPSPAPTPCTH